MALDFFSLPREEKERAVRQFEKHAKKGSSHECWIWEGGINTRGYGEFVNHYKLNGIEKQQIYMAHRFSWMMHWQLPIPKGLYCCHTCDVRDCINPHHLVLGTARTNALDMMNKDRKMKVKRH